MVCKPSLTDFNLLDVAFVEHVDVYGALIVCPVGILRVTGARP